MLFDVIVPEISKVSISVMFMSFIGGFGVFHGYVNCFVHVVMYFYYGVSALGPQYQKYLWWKRYVTVFQLVNMYIYIYVV